VEKERVREREEKKKVSSSELWEKARSPG